MNTQILFNAKDHSYNGKKITYTSVSKLIAKYKRPYNRDYWSTYKAYERILGQKEFKAIRDSLKHPMEDSALFSDLSAIVSQEDLDKAIQEILGEWKSKNDKSIKKGNDYHSFKEDQAKELGFCENPFTGKNCKTILSTKIEYKNNIEYRSPVVTNLYDLEDGFHPELILWNDKAQIAGQADLVFIETIGDKRYIDIDDYKGLSLDTEIPTPTGWTLMKDLKVGDEIFDGKGNITKIKHVSEIHYNPCYKIKFDNNTEIIADHEHKWVITDINAISKGKGKKEYYKSNKELNSDDIFNYYNNNTKKLKIEINNIKLNKIELPIDPYVLGLWLADGNRTCGTLTCVNNNIWKEIKKRGYKVSVDHNRNNDKAESRTIFGISKYLTSLNLIKNKHIPDLYLRSSHEQRLELLKGYMDGDGYYNKTRNRFVMSTTNIRQAKDIQTLVSSLGFKCTIIPYKFSGFGKSNLQGYSVGFTMNSNPFLSRNKDIKITNSNRNYNYITSIEKIETVPTKCLAVESEEKTYLATRTFIMTHNTNGKIDKYNFMKHRMLDPLSHLHDCNLNHYKLQISAYSWLLEQVGFIPRDLGFRHLTTPYRFNYMKKEIENIMPNHYDF